MLQILKFWFIRTLYPKAVNFLQLLDSNLDRFSRSYIGDEGSTVLEIFHERFQAVILSVINIDIDIISDNINIDIILSVAVILSL